MTRTAIRVSPWRGRVEARPIAILVGWILVTTVAGAVVTGRRPVN